MGRGNKKQRSANDAEAADRLRDIAVVGHHNSTKARRAGARARERGIRFQSMTDEYVRRSRKHPSAGHPPPPLPLPMLNSSIHPSNRFFDLASPLPPPRRVSIAAARPPASPPPRTPSPDRPPPPPPSVLPPPLPAFDRWSPRAPPAAGTLAAAGQRRERQWKGSEKRREGKGTAVGVSAITGVTGRVRRWMENMRWKT